MVIKNVGYAPAAQGFWVDIYINPVPIPTTVNQLWYNIAEEGVAWGVVAPAVPLEPGESFTLTFGDGYFWPTLSDVSWPLSEDALIYAQVDCWNGASDYGAVLETHELSDDPYNNIMGPVSVEPSAAGEEPRLEPSAESAPASFEGLPPRP